jgi:hypothetical protein
MIALLASPLFLLVFAVLSGPISRLIGAKVAAGILFCTGAVVLPVLVGITWRVALMGGCDVAVLLAGAAWTRRFAFPPGIPPVWLRRLAAVVCGVLCFLFAALALLETYLTAAAVSALPFEFGLLMSGVALAVFLSRGHKHVFTRRGTGSLVSASPA